MEPTDIMDDTGADEKFIKLEQQWNAWRPLAGSLLCPPRDSWDIKFTTYPGANSNPSWLFTLNEKEGRFVREDGALMIYHERAIPAVIRKACAVLMVDAPKVNDVLLFVAWMCQSDFRSAQNC